MPKIVDIEQRRTELTDAAGRVIARAGIEAATVREVAAEAGWTTGALTHYFADKRELLLLTFQASLSQRRARRPDRDTATSAERLRSSLEGVLPLDEDRRRHWMVTIACCSQAVGDQQLADAQRAAYREFRDHVASLVAAITSRDPDPERAEQLIAIADGVAIQALFDADSWPADRQLAQLESLLRAFGSDLGIVPSTARAGLLPALGRRG